MTIDKSLLLAALAAATIATSVDGFGSVNIRQVSVAENDQIRARMKAEADAPQSRFGLLLLIASVVDDTGARVFSEDDLPALAAAAGSKIDKLVEAVLDVNGYRKEAPGNAAGNAQAGAPASVPTPSADSASGSPSPWE